MEREVKTTEEFMLERAAEFRREAKKVRANGWTSKAIWLETRARLIEEDYSTTEK